MTSWMVSCICVSVWQEHVFPILHLEDGSIVLCRNICTHVSLCSTCLKLEGRNMSFYYHKFSNLRAFNLSKNTVEFKFIWHGYVLHEGTGYHGRVPLISQMTSRLLRHTAAAMRAHNVLCNSHLRHTAAAMWAHNVLCNSYLRHTAAAMRAHDVLCNSYNSITVEINRCSFRSVRFALLYIVTRSKIV
jgi:hypothetical protein